MEATQARKAPYGCAKVLLIIGGLLSILAILVFFTPVGFFIVIPATQHWYSWRNRGEFERHRNRYEGIVRVLENEKLAGDHFESFSLDPDLNPAGLRRMSREDLESRGYELGRSCRIVAARRENDGRLLVVIRTFDYGHAGAYGLVYSSGPPGPFDLKNALGDGGIATPVAPKWWAVEDYTQ